MKDHIIAKITIFLVFCSCLLLISTVHANSDDPEYIDGYEVADFDKFNSYASENGLGGTQICVDGKCVGEVDLGGAYGLILKQNDKQTWFIEIWISAEEVEEIFSTIIDQEIRVFGEYSGFSDILHMPCIAPKGRIERKNSEGQYEFFWSLLDWLDENPEIVKKHELDYSPETEEVIRVLAEGLYDQFENNAIATKEKYKGKTIQVTGTVGAVDKTILGDLYVTLKIDEWGMKNVQCFFSNDKISELTNLGSGQVVTIEGSDPEKGIINVELYNCSIVK